MYNIYQVTFGFHLHCFGAFGILCTVASGLCWKVLCQNLFLVASDTAVGKPAPDSLFLPTAESVLSGFRHCSGQTYTWLFLWLPSAESVLSGFRHCSGQTYTWLFLWLPSAESVLSGFRHCSGQTCTWLFLWLPSAVLWPRCICALSFLCSKMALTVGVKVISMFWPQHSCILCGFY